LHVEPPDDFRVAYCLQLFGEGCPQIPRAWVIYSWSKNDGNDRVCPGVGDRILVVVLDNIGDLVFSSVIFRQLRARWPTCELTVWCKDYAFEIAQLLPGSPRIYSADPIWDKAPGRKKGRWTPFLRTLWELRRHHFDLTIVCSKNWRASAATALLHTKRSIGYAGSKSNRFLCDPVTVSAHQESVIQELNHLLTPLFIPDPQVRYQLDRDSLATQWNRLQGIKILKVGAFIFTQGTVPDDQKEALRIVVTEETIDQFQAFVIDPLHVIEEKSHRLGITGKTTGEIRKSLGKVIEVKLAFLLQTAADIFILKLFIQIRLQSLGDKKFDFVLVEAFLSKQEVGLYGGLSRAFISIQAILPALTTALGIAPSRGGDLRATSNGRPLLSRSFKLA